MDKDKIYTKSGQALLIILLALATLTTIVLSIVARSIKQVEVTNREEESIRAFSAAEAGLEQALVSASLGEEITDELTVDTGGSSSASVGVYTAQVSGFPETSNEFAYPIEIGSGETATIWFVTMDSGVQMPCASETPCFTSPDITVCWGEDENGNPMDASNPNAPALETVFVYEDSSGSMRVTRSAYDPRSSRVALNNFNLAENVNCTIDSRNYGFRQQINLASDLGLPISDPGKLKYMRVKMLYNTDLDQTFGISSSGNFPPQGKKVTSTGKSGNATRQLEAYILNSTIPSIFESAVYSETSIIK